MVVSTVVLVREEALKWHPDKNPDNKAGEKCVNGHNGRQGVVSESSHALLGRHRKRLRRTSRLLQRSQPQRD